MELTGIVLGTVEPMVQQPVWRINMKIMQISRRLAHHVLCFRPVDKNSPLYDMGKRCFDLGTSWFGLPPDTNRAFDIIRGAGSMCIKPKRGTYIIVIDVEHRHPESQLADVAHEIYHRVTGHYTGLRELIWVDEMLAFLFSHHALLAFGKNSYAQQQIASFCGQTICISLAEAQSFRNRRPHYMDEPYPAGFGSCIFETGIRLNNLVSWPDICTIVNCKSWDQWLSRVSVESQGPVMELLNISP